MKVLTVIQIKTRYKRKILYFTERERICVRVNVCFEKLRELIKFWETLYNSLDYTILDELEIELSFLYVNLYQSAEDMFSSIVGNNFFSIVKL